MARGPMWPVILVYVTYFQRINVAAMAAPHGARQRPVLLAGISERVDGLDLETAG